MSKIYLVVFDMDKIIVGPLVKKVDILDYHQVKCAVESLVAEYLKQVGGIDPIGYFGQSPPDHLQSFLNAFCRYDPYCAKIIAENLVDRRFYVQNYQNKYYSVAFTVNQQEVEIENNGGGRFTWSA